MTLLPLLSFSYPLLSHDPFSHPFILILSHILLSSTQQILCSDGKNVPFPLYAHPIPHSAPPQHFSFIHTKLFPFSSLPRSFSLGISILFSRENPSPCLSAGFFTPRLMLLRFFFTTFTNLCFAVCDNEGRGYLSRIS